jgi:hypothetical protein
VKLLLVYVLGTMLWAIFAARRGRTLRPVVLLLVTALVSLGYLSQRML